MDWSGISRKRKWSLREEAPVNGDGQLVDASYSAPWTKVGDTGQMKAGERRLKNVMKKLAGFCELLRDSVYRQFYFGMPSIINFEKGEQNTERKIHWRVQSMCR